MAHDRSRILERFALAAGEARDALARAGVPRWELYAKASEWEEVSRQPGRDDTTVHCRETGLAVRTRRAGKTGFAAASGGDPAVWRDTVQRALATERPDPVDPLPPASALGTVPVRKADALPEPGWGRETLHRLETEIGAVSSGRLRLVRSTVRTGSSGWLLHTAEGFSVNHRTTACLLVAEIAALEPGLPVWRRVLPLAAPLEADMAELARRLVNPFLLLREARPRSTGIADILLDSAVAAHLLAGIVPLLLAPRADPAPGERIGSALLDLVDDRPGEAGPLVAPCDGEGIPSRRIRLVERGVLRRRLACHREAQRGGGEAGGAVRRSYREPPVTGIANLLLEPHSGLPGEALVGAAESAFSLLNLAGPPEIDLEEDRYRLTGTGITLDRGRVEAWHPLAEVRGRVSRLLERLEATGATVSWHQTAAGVVGTPPLLFRAQLVG